MQNIEWIMIMSLWGTRVSKQFVVCCTHGTDLLMCLISIDKNENVNA